MTSANAVVVVDGSCTLLYRAQGGRCWLCGGVMVLGGSGLTFNEQQAIVTRDHVVPKSRGGGDKLTNLRGAHKWCNSARGLLPHELAIDGIRQMLDDPRTEVERYIAATRVRPLREIAT